MDELEGSDEAGEDEAEQLVEQGRQQMAADQKEPAVAKKGAKKAAKKSAKKTAKK